VCAMAPDPIAHHDEIHDVAERAAERLNSVAQRGHVGTGVTSDQVKLIQKFLGATAPRVKRPPASTCPSTTPARRAIRGRQAASHGAPPQRCGENGLERRELRGDPAGSFVE